MILANLGCYKLQSNTKESKPPHLLELIDAKTPVIQTHSVATLDHAGINSSINEKWEYFHMCK
jgi:hypothetical protein